MTSPNSSNTSKTLADAGDAAETISFAYTEEEALAEVISLENLRLCRDIGTLFHSPDKLSGTSDSSKLLLIFAVSGDMRDEGTTRGAPVHLEVANAIEEFPNGTEPNEGNCPKELKSGGLILVCIEL